MDAGTREELIEALVVGPAGAVLLAGLEAEHRPDTRVWSAPTGVERAAVEAATASVAARGADDLCARPPRLGASRDSLMRGFVEPDWDAVAEDWDAIHVTWAGFLTCEGLVFDLAHGDVAMLRNRNSERTLWLNPVLSAPGPLPGPALSGAMSCNTGIDPRSDDRRHAQDLAWFEYQLGR